MKFASNSNYLKLKKVARVVEVVERWTASHKLPTPAVRILDIGCGWSAVYARSLASLGYRVTALDLNKRYIAEACLATEREEGIEFLVAEACQFLREVDRGFNIILAADVMEHLSKPEEYVALCSHRLLSPGLLLILVPDGYGEAELLYLPFAYWLARRLGHKYQPGEPHIQRFSRRRLARLMQTHHLEYRLLSSIFTTRLPFGLCLLASLQALPGYWNIWLADRLPAFMTNSWLVAGQKGE